MSATEPTSSGEIEALLPPIDRDPNGPVVWVERNTGLTLSDCTARCVIVASRIARPYNLHLIGRGWHDAIKFGGKWDRDDLHDDLPPRLPPVEIGPSWLILHLLSDLGTFDGSEMTRLVLAAHEHAVRASVSPVAYRWVNPDDDQHEGAGACLRLMLHARRRYEKGDHGWDYHPPIEDALTPARSGRSTDA